MAAGEMGGEHHGEEGGEPEGLTDAELPAAETDVAPEGDAEECGGADAEHDEESAPAEEAQAERDGEECADGVLDVEVAGFDAAVGEAGVGVEEDGRGDVGDGGLGRESDGGSEHSVIGVKRKLNAGMPISKCQMPNEGTGFHLAFECR